VTDREYINISIVFGLIGIYATAAAIRATDCDDRDRILQLAIMAQRDCCQGALRMLDGIDIIVTKPTWELQGRANSAITEALVDSRRRENLRRGREKAETLAIDLRRATALCVAHYRPSLGWVQMFMETP
jgi:hypothetical protein